MSGGGWSNIYLQLITGAGPVLGEGLLQGWQTSIELDSFKWGCKIEDDTELEKGAGGGLVGALTSLVGIGGKEARLQVDELEFTKRFDIGSAQIHTCLDNRLPVLSASITVLNIKQGGRAIHEPGFTLVATNGEFREASLDLRPSGNGVELVETIKMTFEMIVISYLKRFGKDNIPTNPFIFKVPPQTKSSTPSLP